MRLAVEYKGKSIMFDMPGFITVVHNYKGMQDIISLGDIDRGEEVSKIRLDDHELIVYSKLSEIFSKFVEPYSGSLLFEVVLNDLKYTLYK